MVKVQAFKVYDVIALENQTVFIVYHVWFLEGARMTDVMF